MLNVSSEYSFNETIIISNRKVFDFEHKDSTNGKIIISYMINKAEKKPRQAKKTSISLILINNIDTSFIKT